MKTKLSMKFKARLKRLDEIHWSLLIGLLIVAAAGWWAACQASNARAETDRIRQQYFHALQQLHDPPTPPKGLRP